MLTKKKRSLIKSLDHKKYRDKTGLFKAEGDKLVREVIGSGYDVEAVYAAHDWEGIPEFPGTVVVSAEELSRISSLKTPGKVLCLARMVKHSPGSGTYREGLTLVLEDIRDPGNFGTILRTADWFGVESILCSEESVDIYNPKVIQASMGSFTRVKVVYSDLDTVVYELKKSGVKVFGLVLDGKNIYDAAAEAHAALVFGNESRGISHGLLALVDERITIPAFGGAESLNIAVAAGIACYEFKR